MIVCPVCEHPQPQGEECEVCGKKLVPQRAAAVAAVAPIPELEATHHAGQANVVAERLVELEPTKVAGPVQVAAEKLPELELNQVVRPGLPVQAEPMAELDRGREELDDPKTAPPVGPVTCRYCGNAQAEGLLCERCGMRLPRVKQAAAGAPATARRGETIWSRCKKCGATARAGERCGDCGHEVPMPDNA